MIINSTFLNNSATEGKGGAIYLENLEVYMDNMIISNNTAVSEGGGV